GGLDVEAVAHVFDRVAREAEAVGVPDVNARALLARVLSGNAPDRAGRDFGAAGLAEIDAEERPDDPAVADRHAAGGHVDAGAVPAEIAPALPVDVEALDRDAVGAHAHDAAYARADQPGTAAPDERQRPVEDEIAPVDAGP